MVDKKEDPSEAQVPLTVALARQLQAARGKTAHVIVTLPRLPSSGMQALASILDTATVEGWDLASTFGTADGMLAIVLRDGQSSRRHLWVPD